MNILGFEKFTETRVNENLNNTVTKASIQNLIRYVLRYAFKNGAVDADDVYDTAVLVAADVEDRNFIVKSVNGKDYKLTDLLVHLNFDGPADLETGIFVDESEWPCDYSDNCIIPLDDIVNFNELSDFIESLAPYGKL